MNAKSGAKATAGSINPITLEVVRNGVISICNQIANLFSSVQILRITSRE